jgi:hypothetical protein
MREFVTLTLVPHPELTTLSFMEHLKDIAMQLVSLDMETSLLSTNLSELVALDSSQSSHGDLLLRDMESLSRGVRRLQEALRVDREILDAKLSTAQSLVVTRLTILAFIFIPLNLVCSFFGMNFVELGTGRLKIWVFFSVAVPLVVGFYLTLPSSDLGWNRPNPVFARNMIDPDSDSDSGSETSSGLYSNPDSEPVSWFRHRFRVFFRPSTKSRLAALDTEKKKTDGDPLAENSKIGS